MSTSFLPSATIRKIRADLVLTPQVEATIRAMLKANPTWEQAWESVDAFPSHLLIVARSMVTVLNDFADVVPIDELGLSVRAYNVLRREGIHTIKQLTALTWADLADMRNMGVKAVEDVEARLQERGLKLKDL